MREEKREGIKNRKESLRVRACVRAFVCVCGGGVRGHGAG